MKTIIAVMAFFIIFMVVLSLGKLTDQNRSVLHNFHFDTSSNRSFSPDVYFDTSHYKGTQEIFSETLSQTKDLYNQKPIRKMKVLIIDTKISTNTSFGFLFKEKLQADATHGTEVSSIIFQRLTQIFGKNIADYVEFHSCPVYDTEWSKDQVDHAHINCYQKAVNENFDFINLSVSGNYSISGEKSLLEQISKKGIVMTVSAGNASIDAANTYPCVYKLENIHCVGNITEKGVKASSSNYGENISYWALGFNVIVMDQTGNSYVTGTSQSAPQVLAMMIVKEVTKRDDLVKIVQDSGLVFKAHQAPNKNMMANNPKNF